MPPPPRAPTRDLDELASIRLLHHMRRLRRQMAPVMLGLALVILWVDTTAWRHAVLMVALGTVMVVVLRERRGVESPRSIALTVFAAGVTQLLFVFELGGIASPALPALVIFAVVANVVSPSRVGIALVVGVQIPALWIFAWIHHAGVLPEIVPGAWAGLFARPGSAGPGPFVAATFYSTLVGMSALVGRLLENALLELARERLAQTQVELETHAEATRTLTHLSAEIAHELKNPLASIKGLAALVHRDLSGKSSERMEVLRREVDRMQATIDEFLTYSRPLVPLAPAEVDVSALVRDVLALHEAMGAHAEVRLERSGAPHASLRCDPNKIRQVLVNLVQNALEATPTGGTVRVTVEDGADLVRLHVDDDGDGLGELDAERVFDVGFTTKARGSGIGLAVARGLARQHGGELSLAPRSPRGCRATLALPRDARTDPEVAS